MASNWFPKSVTWWGDSIILHCRHLEMKMNPGKRSKKSHNPLNTIQEWIFFNANHFSISQLCDGGAYLLTVAALPLPPSKQTAATNISSVEGELVVWLTIMVTNAKIHSNWSNTGTQTPSQTRQIFEPNRVRTKQRANYCHLADAQRKPRISILSLPATQLPPCYHLRRQNCFVQPIPF